MSGNALLRSVEMALRYRGESCVWTVLDGSTIVGSDNGRAFAIVIGGPTKEQATLLLTWRRAGASTGVASSIKEALMIVEGAASRAG